MTLRERFLVKVDQGEGCWNWRGAKCSNGYGVFWANGKLELAHRVSHELFTSPIPQGLQIDHLCRNRACVRPNHLEAVTFAENMKRRSPFPAKARSATNRPRQPRQVALTASDNCSKGHGLATAYRRRDGRLRCRECTRLQGQRRRKLPAASVAPRAA